MMTKPTLSLDHVHDLAEDLTFSNKILPHEAWRMNLPEEIRRALNSKPNGECIDLPEYKEMMDKYVNADQFFSKLNAALKSKQHNVSGLTKRKIGLFDTSAKRVFEKHVERLLGQRWEGFLNLIPGVKVDSANSADSIAFEYHAQRFAIEFEEGNAYLTGDIFLKNGKNARVNIQLLYFLKDELFYAGENPQVQDLSASQNRLSMTLKALARLDEAWEILASKEGYLDFEAESHFVVNEFNHDPKSDDYVIDISYHQQYGVNGKLLHQEKIHTPISKDELGIGE